MTGPHRETIAGVILAGGQARRMSGRDKASLEIGGKPMIQRVAERLEPQVGAVAVNANGDARRFGFLGKPVLDDRIGGFRGPLAGVHAALEWARRADSGFTHVATVATDTPFFPSDFVARLAIAADSGERIAVARSGDRQHPVFALWPVALADDLGDWLRSTDTLKVRDWIARHDSAVCDFAPLPDGTDPFFNVNTPHDLAQAETILAGMAA